VTEENGVEMDDATNGKLLLPVESKKIYSRRKIIFRQNEK
jgi:hypothetical protein